MTSPGWKELHTTIWCWYALPLLMSLYVGARVVLDSFGLMYCQTCDGLQVFIVIWFALLPWLGLFCSYVLAGVARAFKVPGSVLLGTFAAGPIVIGLAYFFIVNTQQYLR